MIQAFDTVFHVGGINLFNDKARAIQEMVRVARPGTKIVIVDETEKAVKGVYERSPITARYFRKRAEPVSPPVNLVSPQMLDLKIEVLYKDELYCLTFRNPA